VIAVPLTQVPAPAATDLRIRSAPDWLATVTTRPLPDDLPGRGEGIVEGHASDQGSEHEAISLEKEQSPAGWLGESWTGRHHSKRAYSLSLHKG
jgi:hypothetical protein